MRSFTERVKRFIVDYGVIGSMTGYTAIMPIVGSTILLGTMYEIGPWLQSNRAVGAALVVATMSALAGVALIATNILGFVSGFAFGFPLGLATYIGGIFGASSVMFVIAKRFGSSGLQPLIARRPRLRVVHRALLDENAARTLLVLVLIRLSPAIPFAATNFVVSAAGVSFSLFAFATVIGMLPRAAAVVFVGASLSELDFDRPQESWIVILGIAATVFAIAFISFFARRALRRISSDGIEPAGSEAADA
jgi:uncharacterized membrane protein YdjX (TVP38/TMEM64 family)